MTTIAATATTPSTRTTARRVGTALLVLVSGAAFR